jgi:hypothetical protein
MRSIGSLPVASTQKTEFANRYQEFWEVMISNISDLPGAS